MIPRRSPRSSAPCFPSCFSVDTEGSLEWTLLQLLLVGESRRTQARSAGSARPLGWRWHQHIRHAGYIYSTEGRRRYVTKGNDVTQRVTYLSRTERCSAVLASARFLCGFFFLCVCTKVQIRKHELKTIPLDIYVMLNSSLRFWVSGHFTHAVHGYNFSARIRTSQASRFGKEVRSTCIFTDTPFKYVCHTTKMCTQKNDASTRD